MNTDPSVGALYLDQPLVIDDEETERAAAYVQAHAPDLLPMLFAPLKPGTSRHQRGGPA